MQKSKFLTLTEAPLCRCSHKTPPREGWVGKGLTKGRGEVRGENLGERVWKGMSCVVVTKTESVYFAVLLCDSFH